jgi:hypothetical protein
MEVFLYAEEGFVPPSRIGNAVTNLKCCPAWQLTGPAVKCSLVGVDVDDSQLLVETVAALSGLANKQLELSINGTDEVWFNASVMEQLGRALGSSLTRLEVTSGYILRDFWPAVWTHLPGLQRLSLGPYAGPLAYDDLACFCSHATRPLQLQLTLDEDRQGEVQPLARLQELGSIWGVPHVAVTLLTPEE